MTKTANPGAPDCGLYIRVDSGFIIEDIIPNLQKIFSAAKHSAYKKHMHVVELPAPDGTPEGEINIRALVDFVRQGGFVPLIAGDAEWADKFNADGVLLGTVDALKPARDLLGPDRIIGLMCGEDRGPAEQGLAFGIDYIAFTAGPCLIDNLVWWGGKSDIPALADTPVTNDNCAEMIRAGATFINPTDFILNHPKTGVQGTIDMLFAIDLALKKQTIQ